MWRGAALPELLFTVCSVGKTPTTGPGGHGEAGAAPPAPIDLVWFGALATAAGGAGSDKPEDGRPGARGPGRRGDNYYQRDVKIAIYYNLKKR